MNKPSLARISHLIATLNRLMYNGRGSGCLTNVVIPLSLEERMVDLKQMLSRFLTIPGVRLAVLVGRDGLLIEGLSRDGKEDMETVGAYMTTGLNTAEALGQEISRGDVVGVLTEYEQGLVSVDPLGDFALVVTLFDNASSISRVRHMVKSSRNEILQALDIA